MNLYRLILTSILFVLLGSCKTNGQPNFIFILVDDLGWSDLNCYQEGDFYETPNIDGLASRGTRFTSAYTASPVCSPTRASIMTGKYPARLRITDWIPGQDPGGRRLLGPQDNHNLPLEEYTLAEVLKEKDYRSCYAGKWHLGGEGFYPEEQGFDVNYGGHSMGSPPGGYYSPYKNPKLENGPDGEYLTDRLTSEALNFIEVNRDKPFLVYLSYYTVHTPIQACARHLERFESKTTSGRISDEGSTMDKSVPDPSFDSIDRETNYREEHTGWTKLKQDNPDYASMIFVLDENVGRIIEQLERLQLLDNTCIIFHSDNGGLSTLTRRGAPTSNEPLRAGKGWCYEGGIRVPLIISGPGLPSGKTTDIPVISNDLYPTILSMAGIRMDRGKDCDGMDLLPWLKEAKNIPERDLYWHFPHYHGSAWTPGSAIRSGDWKLIRFYEDNVTELYNIMEDISERTELSQEYPQKKKELEEKLDKWLMDMDAQMPTKNLDYHGQ